MVISRCPRALRALGVTLALGASLLGGPVQAQGSTTPIRILVGFPPGGGTDAIARTLADKLKDQLNQTVLVDNRAGAGGQIAAQVLKAAPADGITVFISHDHTISILPLVIKNPGYDPARDFVPVAGFATFVNALAVSGGTPAKSHARVRRLGAPARRQGQRRHSGAGIGARVPGQADRAEIRARPAVGALPRQRAR